LGAATTPADGTLLDVRFLTVNVAESFGTAAVPARRLGGLATGHRTLQAIEVARALDDLAEFRGTPGHPYVEALEQLATLPRAHAFDGQEVQPVLARHGLHVVPGLYQSRLETWQERDELGPDTDFPADTGS
jgi:hypothetical protein